MSRKIIATAAIIALGCAGASCSKPADSAADNQALDEPATTTGAEPSDEPATTTGAEPSDEPATNTAPPAEPAEAHSSVTFKVNNKTGADRFYFFTRSRDEALTIERREGNEWVALTDRAPTCTEPCPADGSKPTCRPCSPATPRPSVGRARKLEHTWWGLTYQSVRGTQDWCQCHRASAAPLGKYRARLTISPKAGCMGEPCEFDRHGIARGTVAGDPIEAQVEFELTDTDQTVTFTLE